MIYILDFPGNGIMQAASACQRQWIDDGDNVTWSSQSQIIYHTILN